MRRALVKFIMTIKNINIFDVSAVQQFYSEKVNGVKK